MHMFKVLETCPLDGLELGFLELLHTNTPYQYLGGDIQYKNGYLPSQLNSAIIGHIHDSKELQSLSLR